MRCASLANPFTSLHNDSGMQPTEIKSPLPIQPGHEYRVTGTGDKDLNTRIRCQTVSRRVWSHVGICEHIGSGGVRQEYFVKQYIDRRGQPHADQWRQEQHGSRLAATALDGLVHISRIAFIAEEHLLNIFEYRPLHSMDELLREHPEAFASTVDHVIDTMGRVLDRLASPLDRDSLAGLPEKRRSFGAPTALNLKGFEIRNVGLEVSESRQPGQTVIMFDCGKPYLAPIEEAAAKLIVSIGMLNWGRPLRRFLLGPDTALLVKSFDIFTAYVDRRAIEEELRRNAVFRTRHVLAQNRLEEFLKYVGVKTIGNRYFRQLETRCWRQTR